MAAASYLQTSFLGGKWSPTAQGRADQETYRTALNECMNAYPVPTGAAGRRQGTLFGATTRSGVYGVVRTFDFSQDQPFTLEFTAGHIRLWSGISLVLEDQHAVASISTANPAVVKTAVAHGYSTGDQVEFSATFFLPGNSPSGLKPLFNRQFAITVLTSTTFSIADPVTGANIDGSTINTAGWLINVARVVDYATSYTQADLDGIRVVQSEDTALILCAGHKPSQIVNLNSLSGLGTNTITAPATVAFLDGPYLDPPTDGTTLTPSSTTGTITLTASSVASINNGQGFLSTDVGRLVRLYAQPAQWATGTTYSKGQNVTFNNAYYQSLVGGNVGIEPDTDLGTHWAVATAAAAWTWAIIQTVTDTTHVTATIQAADPLGVLAGGDLLNSLPIKLWRLGAWSDSTTWPTGGTFHEGRFWLFSDIKNRADGSMGGNNGTPVQQGLNFAPTALDGTVGDDNGFAAVFEGTSTNSIFWAVSTDAGVVFGTQAGEWVMAASAQDDPITPTSVQAKRKTRYGCSNIEPVVAPLATLFVQRYQRHLYEYISDVYSRKWTGTNLAEKAQDIILPGIAEIALVQEPVPIMWARTTDKRLIGMTYKRESPFGTQPASFFGWHEHALGSGREVVSMRSGPAALGNTDNISMVTLDPATGIYFVEFMGPYFDENSTLLEADFVDAAVTPSAAEVVGNNVIFYGLEYIAGKTITAWVGGVDAGDFTVAADGSLTVPINVAQGLLTSAYLAGLTGGNFALNIQVTPPGSGFFSPVGAALNYVSSSSAPLHYTRGNFDWDAGRLYHEQAQHVGDPGTNGHSLFVFDIATRSQLAGPLDPGELAQASPGVTCMGYDGHIYYGTGDATHLVGRFNTTSHTNDVTYNDGHGLDAVGYIAPLVFDGDQFAVITSLNSGVTGSRVNVIQMTGFTATAGATPAWTGATFTVDEAPGSLSPGDAYPCRGPAGNAFVMSIIPSTAALYRVTVEGLNTDGTTVGMTKIGTIAPGAVHGGWATFGGMGVPIYDETDGNLIVEFNSGGTNVLAKISSKDASVLWTLVVTANVDFRASRVRGGRLSFIDGSGSPWTLKEIDTIAGTVSGGSPTESVIGPNTFSTDDKAGQVVVQINDIATTDWATFGPAVGGGTIIPAVVYNAPTLLGFTYTSDIQILRAISPQETQTPQGPALGKTRRAAQVAVMLASTQGVSFGTDLTQAISPLRTMNFTDLDGSPTTALDLFTGTYWDSIEDDYSFDSMPAFRITRPYPANFLAVEVFSHTQERN